MSLFRLPPGCPPQLAFLWPLIWVQVLMLRAQIRAAENPYGQGDAGPRIAQVLREIDLEDPALLPKQTVL